MSSETRPPAIEVRGIGKVYRKARIHSVESSLKEQFSSLIKAPWRLLAPTWRHDPRDDITALHPVSFEVAAGSKVGLIGRNGSGKSTLLKVLARITPPTTGEATIRGRLASILEVGTGFHPDLTGHENIYLNGAILGLSKEFIRRHFDQIVAFSGLEDFLDLPVRRYSSGMYVRLAFSVAAHLESDVLLIDEVLAVGDQAFREKCLAKMEDEVARGRTIVFVSHDMDSVRSFCDRVIHLADGRIDTDGPPSESIERYLAACQSGSDRTTLR